MYMFVYLIEKDIFLSLSPSVFLFQLQNIFTIYIQIFAIMPTKFFLQEVIKLPLPYQLGKNTQFCMLQL